MQWNSIRANHRQPLRFRTAAFSRSQPTDSQYRRTSSRFCCKALFGIVFKGKRHKDKRLGILNAADDCIESAGSCIADLSSDPSLRTPNCEPPGEKRLEEAPSYTTILIRLGHSDFIDPQLRRLIRMNVVDARCQATSGWSHASAPHRQGPRLAVEESS
jgi:hypothetical protein